MEALFFLAVFGFSWVLGCGLSALQDLFCDAFASILRSSFALDIATISGMGLILLVVASHV